MGKYTFHNFALFVVFFTVLKIEAGNTDIGKLVCTENGLYPDDKLIGVVMQKCQPKLDDPRKLLIACMTKCMMKQLNALTKKGKLKKTEAMGLATMMPAEYQDTAKAKFEECYNEHHSKIKKESKCDSWISFSDCFVGYAEKTCKKATTPSP